MLYIYFYKPNNYFSKEHLKRVLRNLVGKYSGPQAVEDSLRRGLSQAVIPHRFNCSRPKLDGLSVFFVNGSMDCLRWAIKLKAEGKIRKLVAGPNLVVLPEDRGGIILNPNIDLILFPSEWTKNFFCSRQPELRDKIEIWPAGVAEHEAIKNKRKGFLVFYKNNEALFKEIVRFLEEQGEEFDILEYGKFDRVQYYDLLEKREKMIYISNSESQGIALQEAWIRDVPTFAYSRGYWEFGKEKWSDKSIGAPYLTPDCGLFFNSFDDFTNKFKEFANKEFSARDYCLANLSDKKTTSEFIAFIER